MKRALAVVAIAALVSLVVPAVAPGIVVSLSHDTDVAWTSTFIEGVACDKNGFIYAVGRSRDFVDVYTPTGVYLTSYGGTGSGAGQLDGPRDVDVDRWGNIYVLEQTNARVTVFNGLGAFTRHISGPGGGTDDLQDPDGIAVGDDGYVYVADNLQWLKRFDAQTGTWGGTMPAPGPAVGVACDADSYLWVANDQATVNRPNFGNTITYFDRDGILIDSWGATGTATGEFDRLYDVDVDGAGIVYAIDAENHRGQIFEGDGTFVDVFGSNGTGAGEFTYPYGCATGPWRRIEVADTFNDRISRWQTVPTVPSSERSVAGANRYETAVAASQLAWPDGARNVVIATGANWPDALGGAALAGTVWGPLLLTDPDTLSPEVNAEIMRLGASEAYVLGGEGAVSASVFSSLEGLLGAGNVTRLGGSDRYETANLIAAEVVGLVGAQYDGTAFVVTGMTFPDALAASPMAAANSWPIYLSRPDSLGSAKAAMQAAGVTHGYMAGGTAALSADVEADLDATFVDFIRYSGSNRYETAAALATIGVSGMGLRHTRPAIATGENFPDALAGGVLQGSDWSPLLLTPSDSLHASTQGYLDARRDSIYELRFLGGTAAVSQDVRDTAMARLH